MWRGLLMAPSVPLSGTDGNECHTHRIVTTIFAQPSVHGRVQVNHDGQLIAEYDELVPGSMVEITGDAGG